MNVPFFATPYPNPATNIAFPGTGTPFAVTLQLNGGTPPYTATVSSACGNFAASAVSVSAVSGSSTQFVIIPTQAGGACTLSFSDKSTPTNTTSLTVTVNGGASGTVT